MASSMLSPHVPAADFSNDVAHISYGTRDLYQAPSAMQSEYPSPRASPRKEPEVPVRMSDKEHQEHHQKLDFTKTKK